MAIAPCRHCLLISAGTVECGDKCIDPVQQCCPSDNTKGINCPVAHPAYPVPAPGSGTVAAQYCSYPEYACACPLGELRPVGSGSFPWGLVKGWAGLTCRRAGE